MPRKIESKAELIALLNELAEDAPSNWDNPDLKSYLEAMAAWLGDCEGFYANNDSSTAPHNASWQVIADALQAGTCYE